MNFSFLGPFHPQIVHIPIALLVSSALFAIAGRVLDRDWLRKSSVLMLAIGFLGAWLAIQSGKPAHRVPEHDQGVPEEAIHRHSDTADRVLWLSGGALVALGIATRLQGSVKGVVSGLALVFQVLAAGAVVATGYLGGKLTYDHGANVRVDGQLVKSTNAKPHERRGAPGGSSDGAGAPVHKDGSGAERR